jgi:hypothetical protein
MKNEWTFQVLINNKAESDVLLSLINLYGWKSALFDFPHEAYVCFSAFKGMVSWNFKSSGPVANCDLVLTVEKNLPQIVEKLKTARFEKFEAGDTYVCEGTVVIVVGLGGGMYELIGRDSLNRFTKWIGKPFTEQQFRENYKAALWKYVGKADIKLPNF